MSNEAKHTPIPWGWQKFGTEWCLTGQHTMRPIVLAVRGRGKSGLTSLVNGVLVPFYPEHPDAAFIVRACNSHEALVKALEAIEARAADNAQCTDPDSNEDAHGGFVRIRDDARAALKLAKEA